MTVVPLVLAAEVTLGRQRAPQFENGAHVVPYLRSANIVDGALDLSDVKSMNFNPREQAVFGLQPGDVLVTEGSGSRQTVGASAVWNGELPSPVCFQNTLLRLRPRRGISDGRYIAWWARYAHASGLMAHVATGANILHLGAENLRRLPIRLPSLEEQRRITDFLADQVARIDELLVHRRSQIDLLIERGERLVLASVRGEDCQGRPLDRGLTWLGPLPDSWPVLSVASQFDLQLGKMLNEERASGAHLRPYLRNTNIQWDQIETEDLKQMNFPAQERRRYEVLPGDLLICEGGQPGRAAIWKGQIAEIYYQKALHRARSRGRSLTRWLFYCLRAAVTRNAFGTYASQTTIAHLTGEQLRAQRFPFPDPLEQARRVTMLDESVCAQDEIVRKLHTGLELLDERKRALITAAVTGEFDVSSASSRAVAAVVNG